MIDPIVTHFVNLCNFDKVKKIPTGWLFRCMVCGDSVKNKNKRRGKILFDGKEKVIYYCHNCGSSMGFATFLKRHKPHLYQDYKMQIFKQKLMSKGEWIDHTKDLTEDDEEPVKKVTWSDSLLDKLDDIHEHQDALEYLNKRKLPQEFINELLFSDNYLKFLSENGLKQMNVDKIEYDPRVVIPVYNQNHQITHLQGRSIDPKNNIRYVTCDIRPNSKKIWGLDRVDITKPIYIFEGVFDAVFIDNAIAGLGSFIDFDYLKTIARNKLVYCPDADFRKNIHLEKNLESLVKKGIHLYFTPKDIKEKDINDMMVAGWTKDKIQSMINTNTFAGPMALARIKFMKIRKY